MNVKIVDTTLRDGEQKAGIALGIKDKIKIAKILDTVGIYQIESGIPAMCGEEKQSVFKIAQLNLKSKISAWNRMNVNDIEHSAACGVEIIHISVPSSDKQIKSKLNKDRNWVIDNLKRCVAYAKDRCAEVTIGLEDASRADFMFLMRIIGVAFSEGVERIRYADTVGILFRQRIVEEVAKIRESLNIRLEIHAHNDFGMAVSNSVSAVKAGAEFVDCTIGGIGERAGNCDYIKFIKSSKACLGLFNNTDTGVLSEAEKEISKIIKS